MVELGLGGSVTIGVLQLKVGIVVSPAFPFQTKLSGQLLFLFPSLPPPLATSPDSEANKQKEENQTSEEYVGPPAEDLGL